MSTSLVVFLVVIGGVVVVLLSPLAERRFGMFGEKEESDYSSSDWVIQIVHSGAAIGVVLGIAVLISRACEAMPPT